MKLSIVILSYNTKKILADCLRSIYLNYPKIEVIVVDNHSSDGSPEMVRKKFSRVVLIENKKNLGFGKANNIGAKKSTGEIILFLNSDTLVPKNSLEKLIKFFIDNPRAGIVGPKVILPEGEIQPYSFGDDINLVTLIRDKLIKKPSRIRKKVDWVTGAALAVRRPVFEQVNGFDENFFMYFEDSDLCLKVRQAGYQVWLCSSAKIIHLGGKSIKDNRERSDNYYQSQDYYFKKHYGVLGLGLLKIIRWPYRLLKK